jgi:hypothetical protein
VLRVFHFLLLTSLAYVHFSSGQVCLDLNRVFYFSPLVLLSRVSASVFLALASIFSPSVFSIFGYKIILLPFLYSLSLSPVPPAASLSLTLHLLSPVSARVAFSHLPLIAEHALAY